MCCRLGDNRRSIAGESPVAPCADTTTRSIGWQEGSFRRGIDPIELHMTISALSFHHVANRYSFSSVFNIDMSSKVAIQRRGEVVADLILAWVTRL